MNILKQLNQRLIERSKDLDKEDFILRGLWNMDLLFKPNSTERTFSYNVLVFQTHKQGCCYYKDDDTKITEDLMGVDTRYLETDNRNIKTAALDAAYSVLPNKPIEEYVLNGTSFAKAIKRAEIVASEVLFNVSNDIRSSSPSVVNVGVVGNIIKELKDKGLNVYATDLDPNLVNKHIHGVLVQDGNEYTDKLVRECDVALITGMTLITGTLDNIIKSAMESGTKIVMFAETGAWFAQEYCNSFGIDSVVSEPFPFYIFEGTSRINIYRSK